ncbi:transcription factor 21 isoform X1 [Anabrus simplex]|uniref:transcription factor 21 isoform X1 n=1 Tax=Anabrus simplex TaxID=316456 RepID=UPI0034DD234B
MPRRRRSSLSGLSESRDYDTSNDEYANEQVPSRGKPQQRNAANARERARMRVLSKAFGRLKTKLPWVPPDTKLSKLDTLRLATSYISHLQSILKDDHFNVPVHPRSLSWPFTFHQQQQQPRLSEWLHTEISMNTQTDGTSSSHEDDIEDDSRTRHEGFQEAQHHFDPYSQL